MRQTGLLSLHNRLMLQFGGSYKSLLSQLPVKRAHCSPFSPQRSPEPGGRAGAVPGRLDAGPRRSRRSASASNRSRRRPGGLGLRPGRRAGGGCSVPWKSTQGPPTPGAEPLLYPGAASFKGGLIPAMLWGPGAVPKPSARQGQGQGSCPPGPGGTDSSKAVRSWREGHLSVAGSQSAGHGALWKPLPLPASPALGVHLLPVPLQAFTDLSCHPISKPQQDHQGPS